MKHLLITLSMVGVVACGDATEAPTEAELVAAPDLMVGGSPHWKVDSLIARDPSAGPSFARLRERRARNQARPAPASAQEHSARQREEDDLVAGMADEEYADMLRPMTYIDGAEYVGARPDMALVRKLRAGVPVGARSAPGRDVVKKAAAPAGAIEQAYVIGTDTRYWSSEAGSTETYSTARIETLGVNVYPWPTGAVGGAPAGQTWSRNTVATAGHSIYHCSNDGVPTTTNHPLGWQYVRTVTFCAASGPGNGCWRQWDSYKFSFSANIPYPWTAYVPAGWSSCSGWRYDYGMVRSRRGWYTNNQNAAEFVEDFGAISGWLGWTKPPTSFINTPFAATVRALGYPSDAIGHPYPSQIGTWGYTGSNSSSDGYVTVFSNAWDIYGTIDVTEGFSGGPLLFDHDGYGGSGQLWHGGTTSRQERNCQLSLCNYWNHFRRFDDESIDGFLYPGSTW